MQVSFRDRLVPEGRVEVIVTRGQPKLRNGRPLNLPFAATLPGAFPLVYDSCEVDLSSVELLGEIQRKNLVLQRGKDAVIKSLSGGFFNPICRMAVGDRGTIPSDSTVPKVPTDSDPASPVTALYHEVYRGDCDSVALNVGAGVHEVKFIKIFNATDIPVTAYSNQSNVVINEVGLVTADLLGQEGGLPLPRQPVIAPAAAAADESLFSIRTFKSVPFDAAQAISVTIRYTIYIPE